MKYSTALAIIAIFVEIFQAVYGQPPSWDALLDASGLNTGSSFQRPMTVRALTPPPASAPVTPNPDPDANSLSGMALSVVESGTLLFSDTPHETSFNFEKVEAFNGSNNSQSSACTLVDGTCPTTGLMEPGELSPKNITISVVSNLLSFIPFGPWNRVDSPITASCSADDGTSKQQEAVSNAKKAEEEALKQKAARAREEQQKEKANADEAKANLQRRIEGLRTQQGQPEPPVGLDTSQDQPTNHPFLERKAEKDKVPKSEKTKAPKSKKTKTSKSKKKPTSAKLKKEEEPRSKSKNMTQADFTFAFLRQETTVFGDWVYLLFTLTFFTLLAFLPNLVLKAFKKKEKASREPSDMRRRGGGHIYTRNETIPLTGGSVRPCVGGLHSQNSDTPRWHSDLPGVTFSVPPAYEQERLVPGW